jgi:hypothetical protein
MAWPFPGETMRPAASGLVFAPKHEAASDRRKVAPRHVVAVAGEVFGGELPIAGDDPFVHTADDFDATLAAIEKKAHPGTRPPAQILSQRRRLRVEGGKQ